MTAEVQQLAPGRIMRMMKFLRQAGEGIRRIQSLSFRALGILACQAGACITVPQTLQVRCGKLE